MNRRVSMRSVARGGLPFSYSNTGTLTSLVTFSRVFVCGRFRRFLLAKHVDGDEHHCTYGEPASGIHVPSIATARLHIQRSHPFKVAHRSKMQRRTSQPRVAHPSC